MNSIKPRILFIGRFQPLHLGHVHAIKSLMKYGDVIIGIGSSNIKDHRNPFSGRLREEMVKKVFPGIETYLIPDFPTDREWVEWIDANISFDTVATGNSHVWQCFEGRKRLIRIELYQPEKYSGTRIRELMKSGEEWGNLVPDVVKMLIMNSQEYYEFVKAKP